MESQTQEVIRTLSAVGRVDAIDVPELVDENHEGRPFYRSADTREFARAVGAAAGCEVIVNKVVAHMPSGEALHAWAKETVERGLRNVVLVGGSSRYIPYPGPVVSEGNRICRPVLEAASGLLGNIAIPQRVGEPHRMLSKTRAGAAFFTTQILFDAEQVLKMLREYDTLCRQAGLPPASVVVSVAPLADEGDAEFIRWLGADIPEPAEKSILNGDESGAGARSIRHAIRVWHEILAGVDRFAVEVPIGLNVEQVTQRHLSIAGEMLAALAGEIDARPPA